jgi:hypothetical protein
MVTSTSSPILMVSPTRRVRMSMGRISFPAMDYLRVSRAFKIADRSFVVELMQMKLPIGSQ